MKKKDVFPLLGSKRIKMSVYTITNGNNGHFSSRHVSSYPVKTSCQCNHQLLHTKINDHNNNGKPILNQLISASVWLIPTIFAESCWLVIGISFSLQSHRHITYTDGQNKHYNQSTCVTKYHNKWSKGKNTKNKQSRDMVLVYDTSSYCVLQLYEVSSKGL